MLRLVFTSKTYKVYLLKLISVMKNLFSFIIILISSVLFAQEKIDTVIVNNAGTLKIELDQRINKVITAKENASCTVVVKKVVEKKDTSKSPTNQVVADSSDPCAGQTQINGFKIQIYYSKNRSDAQKVKEEFDAAYPSISSQVAYFAPDYRVLVGDYLSKKSASNDIRRLKSKYNSSFSIPYKVLCRRAK